MRRVVILGGGYAGLHAHAALTRHLRKEIASGEVQLTLVSRDSYHTYHGWTGEVLSGRLAAHRTLSPLPPLLGPSFLHATAVSADLEAKRLRLACADGTEQNLAYEHLLVATGSRDPFERIPGLSENGWCLKNSHDMQSLVRHLDAHSNPSRIVVIGGGFAGLETASALAERYGGETAVTLIAGLGEPLPQVRDKFPKLVQAAMDRIRQQGIEVIRGRAATIERNNVILTDGGLVPSDLTVVAAGIAFDILPGTEALDRTDTNRLIADAEFKVSGGLNVWAAGDIAAVQRPGRDELCPIDALWAMKQGAAAGRNIAAVMRGRKSRAFSFRGMGQAAGLADRSGVAELHGLQFTGRVAWLIRIGFFAWYMPYRLRGFGVMRDLISDRRPMRPAPLTDSGGSAVEAERAL